MCRKIGFSPSNAVDFMNFVREKNRVISPDDSESKNKFEPTAEWVWSISQTSFKWKCKACFLYRKSDTSLKPCLIAICLSDQTSCFSLKPNIQNELCSFLWKKLWIYSQENPFISGWTHTQPYAYSMYKIVHILSI